MTPQTAHKADIELGSAGTPGAAPVVDQFVINLCSSTTPMALQQPQSPELRHYKFFISRRLEDGRERFRLHMGYFDTLLQAEDMLQLVRQVYPSAWVSEAPGKRLRAQAVAASAAAVSVPVADPVTPAPAPPKAPELTLAVDDVPRPALAPAVAAVIRSAAAPVPKAEEPASGARVKRVPPPLPVSRSNVREVLASLDEGVQAPAPSAVPTLQAEAGKSMTDSQVLRVLEGGPSETGIHMVKPEETGTFAAIKEAVQAKTPVAFAVQLQWSVQPVDVAKVPPLAIFSAYKLYTVEGSRDGRRWYGLRLGFFSDANSAKQVAQYVRSEFAAVAVVPVTVKERDSASGAAAPAMVSPVAAPSSAPPPRGAKLERLPEQSAEFKLFDDTTERRILDEVPAAKAAPTPASKPVPKPAPLQSVAAKSAKHTVRGKRVQAGEKRGPQTLEETLEILGADALSVDDGRSHALESGGQIKHLAVKVEKTNSRLSRLFGKMGDR